MQQGQRGQGGGGGGEAGNANVNVRSEWVLCGVQSHTHLVHIHHILLSFSSKNVINEFEI